MAAGGVRPREEAVELPVGLARAGVLERVEIPQRLRALVCSQWKRRRDRVTGRDGEIDAVASGGGDRPD